MKKLKILINSKTSGKFHRELIDGRSHVVTQMMPIRGDSAMNSINYPDKDVESSFMQLNMLPAPNGHPTVNGVSVPAFHPVANNKHNIGGFLRNPRKKGKRVFVDFMLDEEVANNSVAGKETLRRIEAGERIGVSTGLGIAQVINKTGTDDFGVKYTREGSCFHFDHVALLLNEKAAGEHAGTELILNELEEEVIVCNCEIDADEDEEDFQPILNNERVNSMDKNKIVLAIIGNSANKFSVKDNDKLMSMSDDELTAIVATNSLDEATAKDFLAINSNIDFAGYDSFKANKVEFDAFFGAKALAEKATVDHIVANSEFTEDMLKGKSTAELSIITNMLDPKKIAVRAGEQARPLTTNSAVKPEVNFD